MKVRLLILLILVFIVNSYADINRIAILPVECIGYENKWDYAIESAFSDELLKNGFEILNIGDLDKILKMQELTLSGVINNSENRIEIGKIIQAEFVLAITVSWNGEYHLFDIRISDIESGKVKFQRVYTTYEDQKRILESGIKIIVANILAKEQRSTIWNINREYSRSAFTEQIVQFARTIGKINILICYAGHESGDSTLDFVEIEEKAKSIFEELINSGEYVILCQFDKSEYQSSLKEFYSSGFTLANKYNTPADYLKDNTNAIAVFIGNTTRAGLVMQNMNIEMRKRFIWIKTISR